jgi:putative CocE/NonD family hydrolase
VSVRIDVNVAVPAGGGTALATDVYRPAGADRAVTTVVTRTAYGKHRHLDEGRAWAARGYAFVVQDVRGRYDSPGTWDPYRHERADGAALVDWVGTQPWAGDVVAFGGSYNAYNAWAAAVTRPDAVRAVVSLAPALGFDAVKFDPSGVLRLAEHVHWWVDRADGRVTRDGLAEAMTAADPSLLRHLPVAGIGERLWARAPGWRAVLDQGPHPGPEAIGDDELAGLRAHSLHVCGWYDLVAADTIRLWQTLADAGHRRARRHTLVLGPWDHDLNLTGPSPAEQVVPSRPFDLGGLVTGWLRCLGDRPTDDVRLLAVGSDRWLHTADWPPAGRSSRWATTSDGRLQTGPGAPAGNVAFVDDPADPFPSVVAGWDRRGAEARRDVARFTSDPLTDGMVIAGTPTVELSAASTTAPADWIARLAVVHPDGAVAELGAGVHVGGDRTVSGVPLALSPCCAHLAPGSRLRLEITGTDFPRLARNLNDGCDRYLGTVPVVSHRSVSTVTTLVLPVPDAR